MTAQAILLIAILIAVMATAIIVVPYVLSVMRGRQVGRLAERLESVKSTRVAGQPISEDEIDSLMREYSAERYARLSADHKRELLQLLGREPVNSSSDEVTHVDPPVRGSDSPSTERTPATASVAVVEAAPLEPAEQLSGDRDVAPMLANGQPSDDEPAAKLSLSPP